MYIIQHILLINKLFWFWSNKMYNQVKLEYNILYEDFKNETRILIFLGEFLT